MRLRVLTYSEERAWRTCPQLHSYRYVQGYEPVATPEPLSFGTWCHGSIEAYWHARKVRGRVAPLDAALAVDPPAAMDAYDRARWRVMVTAYATVWDRTRCEVLAIEQKFRAPLRHPVTGDPHPVFVTEGKIDLLLRASDDRVVLVEHKTRKGEAGEGTAYNNALLLNSQVSAYHDGCAALGYRVDQVLYDVLRKPSLEPRRATPVAKRKVVTDRATGATRLAARQRDRDEAPAEFEARLGAEYAARLSEYVVRTTVHRFDGEMAGFRASRWALAELIAFGLAHGHAPRNDDACYAYQRACAFLPVCQGRAALTDATRYRRLPDVHPELADAPQVSLSDPRPLTPARSP